MFRVVVLAGDVISIHALREESDRHFVKWSDVPKVFQSTPSARRATEQRYDKSRQCFISIHALREESDDGSAIPIAHFFDFNPRPPRGGRRASGFVPNSYSSISIHALREEGDRMLKSPPNSPRVFQSTPSARRATVLHQAAGGFQPHFNPRPPRGGRQQKRRKNPPRLFHYTHLCTI